MICARTSITSPKPLPAVDGLPDGVAELCLRCLAKDPEQRPTSREVARTLAGAAGIRVQITAAEGDSEDLALDPAPPYVSGPLSGRPPGRLRQAVALLFGPAVDPNADTSMLPNSAIDSAAIRNAQRRRRRRVLQASLAAAGLAGAGLLVANWNTLTGTQQSPQAAAAAGNPLNRAPCDVLYETRADAAGQFNVDLTITNNTDRPVKAWMIQFPFSGDQRLRQGLSGQWAQTPAGLVSARDLMVGASLAPRQKTKVAFTADYSQSNPMPTSFTLNGTPCTYMLVGATGETRSGGPVAPSPNMTRAPVGGELPGILVGNGIPVGGAGNGGNAAGGGTGDGGTTPGGGVTPLPGGGGAPTATAPPPIPPNTPTVEPTKKPKPPKESRSPKPPRSKPPRDKPCIPIVSCS